MGLFARKISSYFPLFHALTFFPAAPRVPCFRCFPKPANMSTEKPKTNRNFCSVTSKANGEDPIGSAGTYDHWFIFEIAPPWSEEFWREQPMLQSMLAVASEQIEQGNLRMRPLAIAPDREYSQEVPRNYVRLLYYYRPARLFAHFDKREYILPTEEVSALAIALLTDSQQLPQFESCRRDTSHIREILVCTHGNVDVACSRFGYPIYRKLRLEHAAASQGQLRVWQCSHFGGHRFAPTLIDLPEGRYWGHLEPEMLDLLIWREGTVTELRRFYRGWAGLTQIEQIAEREMWMQQGWQWLDYLKVGRTLAMDENEQKWADIEVEFSTTDRSAGGIYESRIEVSNWVETMGESDNQKLTNLRQYRVNHLVRVD